jgi:glyoxylase-like metal-dependent hydrolase (beta-lactamase superfamily II)
MFLPLLLVVAALELPPGLTVVNKDGVNHATVANRVSIYRGSAPVLLQTHARRDVVGRTNGELVVPEAEEKFFTNPGAWWDLFRETRFHDYDARHSKIPVAPVTSKVRAVKGGDIVEGFNVFDTPGYTPGAVSYLVSIGGKRVAFTGDLIYDGGRIIDLYSLQDAVPEAVTSTRVGGRNTVRGYHGFAARAADLMESLRKIQAAKPDLIVPARGPVIADPAAAIATLLGRLQSLMQEHFSTDALRWYWGDDNLRTRARRMVPNVENLQWMEMAQTRKLPDWIIAIQNSRLIVSRSGGAFLVDCGNERIWNEVEKLRAEGRFKKLEGIFVTHYHDDHTDFVAEASKRSGAPVYYASELKDVIEKPGAYKLPCLTRNGISTGQPTSEGQKRTWHEFEMEFAYFPGQTLYHDVLVLSHSESGMRIVFTGDSFTPSGIDDYCLLNRDFLGDNQGYLYCLRYLRKLGEGTFVTNQHVDPMWNFTTSQIDRMEESLRRRGKVLRELFPYDSPNYGVDEQWARMYPYGNEAKAGEIIALQVKVTNHSPSRRVFTVTPHAPAGWKSPGPAKIVVDAGQDGAANFKFQVPKAGTAGLNLITADIASGQALVFNDFVEAMVNVAP